jgi:hypothetical protein
VPRPRRTSQQPAPRPPPGSDGEGADDAGLPLTRALGPAQAEEERKALRGMWETAAVLRLLAAFKAHLGLTALFTASELEQALVADPGDAGLLAQLHIDLLGGLSPAAARSVQLTPGRWAAALRGRLDAAGVDAPDLRRAGRGREAAVYAALPAAER